MQLVPLVKGDVTRIIRLSIGSTLLYCQKIQIPKSQFTVPEIDADDLSNEQQSSKMNEYTYEELRDLEDSYLSYCRPDSVTSVSIQVSAYGGVVFMFLMAVYASLSTTYRSRVLGIPPNKPEASDSTYRYGY